MRSFTNSLSNNDVSILNDTELNKHSKSKYIETIYYIPIWIAHFFYTCITIAIKTCGVYVLWICLHYVSAHLYVKMCVPNTIMGFIMSPFMMSTPHCQGLRWIVYNASNVVNNMWMVIGAWIYSLIWITTTSSQH